MKTKLVYCLVSSSKDYYYEQLLISLTSLRKHNPNAEVEVVCDQDTFTTLTGKRQGILDYSIHVIPVETPKEWDQKEKSRYIKTNLRKLTQGDYLYIDTDTVICTPLDFIDDFPIEIGAVYDSHLDTPLPKPSKCKYESQQWIWGYANKLGRNIEGLWHFNSGVFFVKDTPKAHELYERWSRLYQEQLKYGIKYDQLPLLLANKEMDNIISPLDWNMNCQVPFEGIRSKVAGANIIHYFPQQQTTILSTRWLLDPIKDSGEINSCIKRIIDKPALFFRTTSKVVAGNASSLLNISPLLEAYSSCPVAFNMWVSVINLYLRAKKKLHR